MNNVKSFALWSHLKKISLPGGKKGLGISNIILCLSFSQQTQLLIEPIYQTLSSVQSLLSG